MVDESIFDIIHISNPRAHDANSMPSYCSSKKDNSECAPSTTRVAIILV